jgi:hypothetical protein
VDWRLLDESVELQSTYLDVMQSQLDSRYTHLSTRPGWRIVILQKSGLDFLDVLYVWNHTHHDGMSAKIFHQHLLRSLNETIRKRESILKFSENPNSWIIDLPDPSKKLPPNPEMLSSWPMTLSFLIKELWKELKPTSLFPPNQMHAKWAPIRASPFATQFRTFTIDCDTVTKVVNACRSHQTTLTGLLHSLVLVSLTSILKNMNGFASRNPYDLRHILPSNHPLYPWLQPKESMCNYVSVVDHEFDVDLVATIRSKLATQAECMSLSTDLMDLIWSVSTQVRQEIQARLDSGVQNDMIGIMKLASDWRAQQQSEIKRMTYFSWLVTNLGVFDGGIVGSQDSKDNWSIQRAELVLSAEVSSAALSVFVASVKNRQMCITCSWQDCVVDSDIGNGLVGYLERWLNEIGDQ